MVQLLFHEGLGVNLGCFEAKGQLVDESISGQTEDLSKSILITDECYFYLIKEEPNISVFGKRKQLPQVTL